MRFRCGEIFNNLFIATQFSCRLWWWNNFKNRSVFDEVMPKILQTLFFRTRCSTRNTSNCDQSNYFSRLVFSHIPIKFVQTGNSAIRSADPENPTVEPNMKWIGPPLAEIWPFEIFPNVRSSVVSRSVLNIGLYLFLYWSHILLLDTLGT